MSSNDEMSLEPDAIHQVSMGRRIRRVSADLTTRVHATLSPPAPPRVDVDALVCAIQGIEQRSRQRIDQVLEEIRTQCRQLVAESVQQIVGGQIEEGTLDWEPALQDLIARSGRGSQPAVLRAHPLDAADLRRSGLLEKLADHWVLEDDESLIRGDLQMQRGPEVQFRSLRDDLQQLVQWLVEKKGQR